MILPEHVLGRSAVKNTLSGLAIAPIFFATCPVRKAPSRGPGPPFLLQDDEGGDRGALWSSLTPATARHSACRPQMVRKHRGPQAREREVASTDLQSSPAASRSWPPPVQSIRTGVREGLGQVPIAVRHPYAMFRAATSQTTDPLMAYERLDLFLFDQGVLPPFLRSLPAASCLVFSLEPLAPPESPSSTVRNPISFSSSGGLLKRVGMESHDPGI